MNNLEDIEGRILYEDNHLIILNKHAGEIVQGDKTGDIPLLEKVRSYIKEKYHKPGAAYCGLVHRIDRPVSGIVIFTKTSKALSRMNELVKNRKISKIYWAIVEKEPPIKEQKLTHFLQKNEKNNKSFISFTEKEGFQKAELYYRILGNSDKFTLLEVELYTGRHHQIRAQLASIGSPIQGDLKYGAKRSNKDGSISLHARKIEFEHPISKQILSITAPVPEQSLWDFFEKKFGG